MSAKKQKDNKPHWLWRLVSGTYGLNGPSFFNFLSLSRNTHKLADKLIKEMKKDGRL
jgi:hypothetical protein